jgi:hypothetical protein
MIQSELMYTNNYSELIQSNLFKHLNIQQNNCSLSGKTAYIMICAPKLSKRSLTIVNAVISAES